MILLNLLWFFCACQFLSPRFLLSLMWRLYYGGVIYLFVLGQKSGSSKSGSEHLALLFYHFSTDQIIMCVDLSVLYTIKNVFHFLGNHCGCQTQPKWQSEEQSLLMGTENVQKSFLKAPADAPCVEKYLATVISWVVRSVAFTDICLISLVCP